MRVRHSLGLCRRLRRLILSFRFVPYDVGYKYTTVCDGYEGRFTARSWRATETVLHGEQRLKSEVIRVRGNAAEMQVYELTGGLKVGEQVEFTQELLSVELGPGLLGQIYDGLQNPLPELATQCGFFLKHILN